MEIQSIFPTFASRKAQTLRGFKVEGKKLSQKPKT
jgi:hypothetical protein